jgi:hypothetical protein
MKTERTLEVMMRIKLPVEGGFIRTSMSSDYTPDQQACMNAIFAAKPQGFEVRWPQIGERWPVDSEGVTYVPLYLGHAKDAHAFLIENNHYQDRKIQELKRLITEISKVAGV